MNKKLLSFFVALIIATVFLGFTPSDANAYACRARSDDPKWEIVAGEVCTAYDGSDYVDFCSDRCNFCGGASVQCKSPSESNQTPGCEVKCAGESFSGEAPPDKDIIWTRVFTRDYGGGYRYFGNGQAIPSTVNDGANDWNFKDSRVSVSTSKVGDAETYNGIWAGHFCGLGKAINVDASGRLLAKESDKRDSVAATVCGNTASNEYGYKADYDAVFFERGCSACQFDEDFDDTNCLTQDKYSGEVLKFEADRDGCEQLGAVAAVQKYAYKAKVDPDLRHPLNKLYDLVNFQTVRAETATKAEHPWQRYDKTFTYTTLNAKVVENTFYKHTLTAPDGYFCYKMGVLPRDDSGVKDYKEMINRKFDYVTDQSVCSGDFEPQGGGSYVLFQIKKSVKGKVVGLKNGTTVGLPNILVKVTVGNSNDPSTYAYLNQGYTNSEGIFTINDSRLQDYKFYNVEVVSGAPTGYVGSAFAIKWDEPYASSGTNIPYTWKAAIDTGYAKVGDSSYSGQATFWDNDCSSNASDGSKQAGRCYFGFKANTPPTCTGITYESSPGTYTAYDNNLEWSPNTAIRLRAVATDPEGDFISGYLFDRSCGTIDPISGAPITDIRYTTPAITSTSCTYTVNPMDVYGTGYSCSITIKTKVANTGSLVVSSSDTLTKLNNVASATATVSDFVGTSPAVLTIQPWGLCAPGAGICTFNSTGTTSLTTNLENASHPISILLKDNPFGRNNGGLDYIFVNYSPTGGNANAGIPITDDFPVCTSYQFGQTMPTNSSTINYRVGVSDDWSVKGLGVDVYESATGAKVATPLSFNTEYFATKSPITRPNDERIAPSASTYLGWDASTFSSGRYKLQATISDTLGQTTVCPFSPEIVLDKDAPNCTGLSVSYSGTTVSGVVPTPTDSSPLTISSTSTDALSRIRGVTYIVVPNGTSVTDINDPSVYKYRQEFLTPGYATQTVGTPITITTPASSAWVTSGTLRGKYTVYAQWFDEAGNVPNGINNCKTEVELGSRYRVKVLTPSDDPAGYDYAAYDASGGNFGFASNRNSGTWSISPSFIMAGPMSSACTSEYPDGNPNNDHGECEMYYISNTVYGEGDTANLGVYIPEFNTNKKYLCDSLTVDGTQYTRSAGQLTTQTIGDLTYCILNGNQFAVAKGTFPTDTDATLAYPSQVEVRLSYNTNAVTGRLFDKNGSNVSGSYSISTLIQGSSVVAGPNATAFGAGPNRYFIAPGEFGGVLESSRFWVNDSSGRFSPTFTVAKSANEMCFFTNLTQPTPESIASSQPPMPPTTYADIVNILRTRTGDINFNDTCTVSGLSGIHGRLSPLYQNQLSILVAPRLRIGETPVKYVEQIRDCDAAGLYQNFPDTFDVKVQLSSGGTNIGPARSVSSSTGMVDFSDVTLDYRNTYNLLVTMGDTAPVTLQDFVICDLGGIARTNPYVFSPLDQNPNSYFNADNNNYGINYPNVNPPSVDIETPIIFALKDTNKWYQVYNGGVHDNSKLSLNSNTEASIEGMPSEAVLVGDPTGSRPVPQGYNMYSTLPATGTPLIAGGNVSAYDYDPTSFSKFGLTGIPNVDNWNTVDFVNGINKPMQFENSLVTVFQLAKNNAEATPPILGYSKPSSLANALKTNKSYYYANGTETLNSAIDFSGVTSPSIVAFVDFSDPGSEVEDASLDVDNILRINRDIVTNPNQNLIIYVNGNVEIGSSVTKLNSVVIVATGSIKFSSKGEDQDVEIDMRGALYGKTVVFERDLNDSGLNLNPSTRVMYDNRMINLSKNPSFASEITESRIYWVLKE